MQVAAAPQHGSRNASKHIKAPSSSLAAATHVNAMGNPGQGLRHIPVPGVLQQRRQLPGDVLNILLSA
jgi:hypothetical protein